MTGKPEPGTSSAAEARPSGRGPVLACALELGVVLLVPVLFLWRYVGEFARPSTAVAPHLLLVFSLWLMCVWIRVWVRRRPSKDFWGGFALPLMTAAVLFIALLYYGLALSGLAHWNNVISWELIRAYSTQVGPLATALEIPLGLLAVLLSSGFVVLFGATWWYHQRWDWTRGLASRLRSWTVRAGGVAVLVLAALQVAGVTSGQWAARGEPVALTVRTPPYHFQNHAMAGGLLTENNLLDQRARQLYSPGPDARPQNVVLIVVDGLRPDHMGVLGYPRETTPMLSELAQEVDIRTPHLGLSICAESLCGLLGIAASSYIHRFSEHPVTLQEVLRRHGYRVHMVLSGDHRSFYGLRTVYGEVDTFVDGSDWDSYPNDDGAVLAALEEFPPWDGSPTMFQLHLMSPHLLIQRRLDPVFTPAERPNVLAGTLGLSQGTPLAHIVNFYDNGVVEADHHVGRILDLLGERGYLDSALVVITSDHGEGLGEHGIFGHANSVNRFALTVPLLFFGLGDGPAFEGFEDDRIASIVDIAPTLLYELGMPIPASWRGEPLQAPSERGHLYFQQGPLLGLLDLDAPGGPWKVWIDSRSGDRWVVHVEEDPGEKCNLAEAVPVAARHRWDEAITGEFPLDPGPWPAGRPGPPTSWDGGDCESAFQRVESLSAF